MGVWWAELLASLRAASQWEGSISSLILSFSFRGNFCQWILICVTFSKRNMKIVGGFKYLQLNTCMDSIVLSLNSYVEVLTPNVTIFGDRASKEVVEIKRSHQVGALIWWDWCPYRKRDTRAVPFPAPQREDLKRRSKTVNVDSKRALSRSQICLHLELGLPDSRTVRK